MYDVSWNQNTVSGNTCKHPGYDEFNPPSWPSECGPNKEDWIDTTAGECRRPSARWGNVFMGCSDIAIKSCKKQLELPGGCAVETSAWPPLGGSCWLVVVAVGISMCRVVHAECGADALVTGLVTLTLGAREHHEQWTVLSSKSFRPEPSTDTKRQPKVELTVS